MPAVARRQASARVLADITATAAQDIVGFGDDGVFVALSNGDGTFSFTPVPVLDDFGFERRRLARRQASALPGRHHRQRARRHRRLRRRRRVGRARQWRRHVPAAAVRARRPRVRAGGWRVDKHPRVARRPADQRRQATSSGSAIAGVFVALQQRRRHVQLHARAGDRRFRFRGRRLAGRPASAVPGRHAPATAGPTSSASATPACMSRSATATARSASRRCRCSNDFGFEAGGWRVEKHPRFLADLPGNGRADIVGFGNAGVYVALSNTDGTFGPVRFVLSNFGCELTILAILQSDREFEDAGIWRSSDRGNNWSRVHPFPAASRRGGPGRRRAARLGAGHGESRLRGRRQLARGEH